MIRAQDLLAEGRACLRDAGVQDPAQDARWLLAYALDIGSERLVTILPDPVPPSAAERFRAAIAARAQFQPVSQILGHRLFWGRRFFVTPDVLDPRPETETLVAAALETDFDRVLDLGTGSGAILLSLLAERPGAKGLGVDLSPEALEVARRNARALELDTRAEFLHSDWCSRVRGCFDLVVSNPPYIAAPEYGALAPELRLWEPSMALVPQGCDGTGLVVYRIIATQSQKVLRPGGWLMVEFGLGQGAGVQDIFSAAGLENIALVPDMTGRARVCLGQVHE